MKVLRKLLSKGLERSECTSELCRCQRRRGDTAGNGNIEENNYYPFGLKHRGYNELPGTYGNAAAQKYTFNGKEYNDALGLNIYEMDWRQYDPAIGRWTVIHHEFSPYSAFDNNPAFWSDPSGANSVRYNWGSGNYDVVDNDGKWVSSFEPGMFGDYLAGITETIDTFFSLEGIDGDPSGGGGDGNGKGKKDTRTKEEIDAASRRWSGEMLDITKTLLEVRMIMTPLGEIKAIFTTGTTVAKSLPSILKSLFKSKGGTVEVSANRLNHIFGKSEHALDSFVTKFGSQEKAYNAVQNAANQALKAGNLTPNAKGILPSGDMGNIINVGGINIRLIGGRVENGAVILSSFSRKGL